MADYDDMPDLVDSSEDEENLRIASNYDYADVWMCNSRQCLSNHSDNVKKCAYGPLLFGFCNNVPKVWITALHQSSVLLTPNREKEVSPLSKEEWEMTEIFSHVYDLVHAVLENKQNMKEALDVIDEIENRPISTNEGINVDKAIDKAQGRRIFRVLWESVKARSQGKKFRKAAQFCIIYVFKNYHHHVLGYGRDGKLIESEIKSALASSKGDDAEQSKEKGNKAFKENKLELAVRWYTQAIKKDPLNHIFYGNRSQAYLKLKKFREALCDGLRAVSLDSEWPKGYYRFAEAYFELGLLDKAREINNLGRQACLKSKDSQNLKQIDEQSAKFKTGACTKKQRLERLNKNNTNRRGPPPQLVSDMIISDSEEEEAPGLISDSDDNVPPPVKAANLRHKQEDQKNVLVSFQQLLKEGSDALDKKHYTMSLAAYQRALESHATTEYLMRRVNEKEYVVLRYALGVSAVATNSLRNIIEAISGFQLISRHPNVKFPACYYGLGKAYVTLNRFSDASKPLKTCLAAIKSGCVVYNWPGTNREIPETRKDKLELLLKALIEWCKCPPSPCAVCRHNQCLEIERGLQRSIYVTDPEYKGFVRISCQSMCVVEFHLSCWKSFKLGVSEKASDKDILDQACPTPDCASTVQKICLYRKDNAEPKVLVSEKPVTSEKSNKSGKKLQKEKPSSQDKISRKAEKKALRKQKRKEARGKDDGEGVDNADEDVVDAGAVSLAHQVLQDETYVEKLKDVETVLYKKDEVEDDLYKGKQKTVKQKKKKEKSKQVLNVQVNFADNKQEHLLGEHSVTQEEEAKPGPKTMGLDSVEAFSVPEALQQRVKDFNSVYDQGINPQSNQHNEVAKNLFVYFEEHLAEHGPQHIRDEVLVRELEFFPQEAQDVIETYGGLQGFLQQSVKFVFVDNFVCLLKDAARARSIASARKAEFPDLGRKQFSAAVVGANKSKQSGKKTVGNLKSLNPGAAEFIPAVSNSEADLSNFVEKCNLGESSSSSSSSCESVDNIEQLVKNAAAKSLKNKSSYNSLDDFAIPCPSKPEETVEKASLFNMDDIDDIQLLDEDLQDGLQSVLSARSDDLDPSRCSSRSSHSELSELDLGYRSSPLHQNFKSAYSKPGLKTDAQDVFSDVSKTSFEKASVLSSKNSLDGVEILPQSLYCPSPQNGFGSIGSGSPTIVSSATTSVSYSTHGDPVWGFAGSTGFSGVSLPKSLDTTSLFSAFQTTATPPPPLTPFTNLTPIQAAVSVPTSTPWSAATQLPQQDLKEQTPYSFFPSAHPWQNDQASVDVRSRIEVSKVSVGTNTDDEMMKLFHNYQEQNVQLVTILQKTEEEKVSLKKLNESLALEKMKMAEQQEGYRQQLGELQQQLQAFQQQNFSLESARQRTEASLEELRRQQTIEAEQRKKEVEEVVSSLSELQKMYEKQTERAINAEKELIEISLTVALQPYNTARHEASFHQHNVVTFINKCREKSREVPDQIQKVQTHFKDVIEKCDAVIADLQKQYEEQIQKVREGQLKSSLAPVNSPPAPPVPFPQEIAAMMSQGFGLNNARAPVQTTQSEASLKTVQTAPINTPAPLTPLTQAPKMGGVAANGGLQQPKPIRPLGLSGAVKGLGNIIKPPGNSSKLTAINNGLVPQGNTAKSSYDKLISALEKLFPNYTRMEFRDMIQAVRKSRGGSLSGVSMEDIVNAVMEMVMLKEGSVSRREALAMQEEKAPPPPPPGIGSAWSFNHMNKNRNNGNNTRPAEVFLEEENPCAICHDELDSQPCEHLDCGHQFHAQCIRSWFKEQNTCPNCRVHALLPDDFPSLK